MPQSRSGRIAIWLIIAVVLAFIGRNLYRRYLNTALIDAVRMRDVAAVRSLLNRGADPNTLHFYPHLENQPPRSQPVLDWVLSGLVLPDQIVQNPSHESLGGEPPPSFLPDPRGEEIACLLISKGAANHGLRYLEGACSIGDIAVARCLLDHGVDVKSHDAAAGALGAALRYALSLNPAIINGVEFSQATTQADRAEVARRGAVSRELVQMLRDHGAHPTLMQAQQLGDRAAETEALNGDPAAWADEGYAVLSVAARQGDLDLMRKLLDRGVDPNHQPRAKISATGMPLDFRNYDLPLHLAATQGNLAATKLLLDHHADPNAQLQYGEPPMSAAARTGNQELVTLLLAHGADPNCPPAGGETPLSAAAGAGKLPIVQLLLAHGAKINPTNASSPLQSAAWRGHADVVRYLLEHGADPNISKSWPVLVTALRSAPQAVPDLLKHGANVNPPQTSLQPIQLNDMPLSPLINAVWNAPQYESLLVQAGAKIGADRSAICVYAVQHGRADLLPKLIAYGADVNGVNPYQEAALFACITRAPSSVKLLLDHGANPNTTSREHRTPLEEAAMTGNAETVHLLLAHGADVNANPDHHTALEWAQRKKHADIVTLLQQAGAKQ